MNSLRIFISSPGDVSEERDKARQVIAGLQRQIGDDLVLNPVLWEELPLGADASFQQGIDLVLSAEEGIDVAVFILWSRLGSPLGPAVLRADGSPYRSGTEREFALMLEARRQSGGSRPHLLAYVRQDDVGFVNRLRNLPKHVLEEEVRQQRLAEEFIAENFHDQETRTNLRAYHSYPEPITFANRLRVHLRELIDARLEQTGVQLSKWEGEPYRAFDVFDLEHSDIFHGRDTATADLELLLRRRSDVQFAVVVGASGSGKSSLVRAGLASNLLRFNLDDKISRWGRALLLPSECEGRLVPGLARVIQAQGALPELLEAGIGAEELAESLTKSPDLAVNLALTPAFLRAAAGAGAVKLLIIVDQLEELYTDRRITDEDRTCFFDALHALASSGHCWIVATLRSDFYGLAQKDRNFLRLKGSDGQFDLAAPEASELRRMITEPARLAGLLFEKDERTGKTLDQVLLDDAISQADALPLLEFALHELYQRRNGRTLTFECYRQELGGLAGAVGQRAETVVGALPPESQGELPSLFQRLVTLDPQTESTAVRRRAIYDPADTTSGAGRLIGALISARLLTAGHAVGESTIALAHEALLTSWERLAEWVKTNHKHLRLRTRIENDLGRWRARNSDPSLLLADGLPVEEGKTLLAEAPHLLSPELADYVGASIRHHAARVKRRTRRRHAVVAALIVLAAVAVAASLWANRQRHAVERLLAAASFREATVQIERGEPAAALAFLARALRLDGEHTGARALTVDLVLHGRWPATVAEHPKPVTNIQWSPDGNLIWTRTSDGEVRVLDSANQTLSKPFGEPVSPAAVAWSPDGTRLATGTVKDTSRIWAAQSGRPLEPVLAVPDPPSFRIILPGLPDGIGDPLPSRVLAMAWRPDGARLATAHQGSRVLIWDVRTGQQTGALELPPGRGGLGLPLQVDDLKWSPDGTRLVTSRPSGEVQVWDARTGRPAFAPFAQGMQVQFVEWSPDSSYVAAGFEDKPVHIWDAGTGQLVGRPLAHGSALQLMQWSPDSARIATASSDGTFQTWNARTGEVIGALSRLGGTPVALSDDWTRLVAVSGTSTVSIWDLARGQTIGEPLRHPNVVGDVAWSPDGDRVATACEDGTVRVWNAWATEKLGIPLPHRAAVAAVAWTSERVSALSEDGTATFWNQEGRHEATVALKSWFSSPGITETAWSHDGRHIGVLTGAEAGVWDVTTGGKIGGPPRLVYDFRALAWNPDASRFAVISNAQPILTEPILTGTPPPAIGARVLDAGTDQALGEPLQLSETPSAMAWSPDGTRILTGSYNGAVEAWDARTGARLGLTVRHQKGITAIAFSRSGAYILTGSGDGTARVWDARTGQPVGAPMQHQAEVRALGWSPDETRVVTGSLDSTARVWDARTGLPVGRPFRHHDRILAVAWNSDGTRVATASADRSARLWDVPALTAREAAQLASWAELIGGLRVNEDGGLERIGNWAARRRAALEQSRRSVTSDASSSALDRLMNWSVSSNHNRNIGALSAMTFEEYVRQISSLGDSGRAEIQQMFPGYRLPARAPADSERR
jgi:WD40 repeat protein